MLRQPEGEGGRNEYSITRINAPERIHGPPKPLPGKDQYTLGWLCALDLERSAATTMLDETFDTPEDIPAEDTNDYRFGRIGNHLVVIAKLPVYEIGISPATAAVKDMARSFSLRAVLMVGVAGGVPSQGDIRLGDVVVSHFTHDQPAVHHYTHGRVIQKATGPPKFESTGSFDRSPKFIRTAVSELKGYHDEYGHKIQDIMKNALDGSEMKRKMKDKLRRPDSDSDKLFKLSTLHIDNNSGDCADCCMDKTSLVERPERDPDDAVGPVIHYGPIGCADVVMKDAELRDMLSYAKGILCFEMETAGIMNEVPAMAIRGICDYADSHKNQKWQGYAAMTAAGYTKELLLRIRPGSVAKSDRIIEKSE